MLVLYSFNFGELLGLLATRLSLPQHRGFVDVGSEEEVRPISALQPNVAEKWAAVYSALVRWILLKLYIFDPILHVVLSQSASQVPNMSFMPALARSAEPWL